MDTDATGITVTSMEVELGQQDGYVDNIVYSIPDTTPPAWDAAVGICSAQDTTSGGSVVVEFGSATDDVNGSNLSYNIYYAPTAVWNGSDWSTNDLISDVAFVLGAACDNAYTITGLQSGTEYTFGVRVEDVSGNEDGNTAITVAVVNFIIIVRISAQSNPQLTPKRIFHLRMNIYCKNT